MITLQATNYIPTAQLETSNLFLKATFDHNAKCLSLRYLLGLLQKDKAPAPIISI